ncbi:MAG: AzlD domain-containing protein [Candidatus Limnocylindrus sp.]
MIDPLRIDLVPLAVLGGIGTYAARALPLLAPGVDRLPAPVLTYLRLIGPAALGAIAAADIFVADGAFRVGPEAVAVITGAAVGWLRSSLLVGMAVSVVVVLLLRATIAP